MRNPSFNALDEIHSPGDLEDADFYVQAVVAISQSFAPNANAPLMGDMPFTRAGGKLTAAHPGFDEWQSHMLIYMVPDYVDNLKRLHGLRFDSAFDEQYTHIPVTCREFSRGNRAHLRDV